MGSLGHHRRRALLVACLGAGIACSGGVNTSAQLGGAAGDVAVGDAGDVNSFVAVPPAVYVAAVKGLLTGAVASADEVQAVVDDPNSLRDLIDGWMATPAYEAKMVSFFSTAFQQDQVRAGDLGVQPFAPSLFYFEWLNGPKLLANVRESFGRTAMALIKEGRPFTETMTTTRFMMTTPLVMYLAYIDTKHADDLGNVRDRLAEQLPAMAFTVQSDGAPIPWSRAATPGNPNYMQFAWDGLKDLTYFGDCHDHYEQQRPLVFNAKTTGNAVNTRLLQFLQAWRFDFASSTGGLCAPSLPPSSQTPYVPLASYGQWRMVEVRPPKAGEATTPFYSPLTAESAQVVLTTPRVGFFTTPAFLAQWPTNTSNSMRAPVNQTLIVGLGRAFDGSLVAAPLSEAAVDTEHSQPGTVCYGCHQNLDPMRQFFLQSFSLSYSDQTDAAQRARPGMFAFDGVSVAGQGVADLGAQLAQHPRLASAWTQRLCTYARAAPCDESDPEFVRVATAFAASQYSWSVLVRELFASPLVTAARPTATATGLGQVVPVAKRAHLCAALSERLGLTDACGLDPSTRVPDALRSVQTLATVLPSDAYRRGDPAPVLANAPGLFFRTSAENLCAGFAAQLVDAGDARFSSAAPDQAVTALVRDLMGLQGARAEAAATVLAQHLADAQAAGVSATAAMQSTFILACLSPSVMAVGF